MACVVLTAHAVDNLTDAQYKITQLRMITARNVTVARVQGEDGQVKSGMGQSRRR